MKLPFHKRIFHHSKRYAKHLTKYLYERDTIFATLSVFIFLFLLGIIPINFYVLNPMKMALKDFDFNDIAYAKAHKDDSIKIDRRIVIVNNGNLDRAQLGFLIETISAYKPKVIGVDIFFEGEREPEKDSILREAFRKTKNLVAVSVAQADEHGKVNIKKNNFDDVLPKRGYANLIGEDVGTIRYYNPFDDIDGKRYPQITSAIVKEYNDSVYKKLENRHKEVETINYTRTVNNEDKKKYQVVEPEKLFEDGIDTNMLRDKIVLLGYVNLDPNNIEDKKFTPMNSKFYGKQHPDMNGIILQANIISMVLDGEYINKMPAWVAWVFALLIGWLHMSLYIRFYLEDHIWFHLVAKLTQVFSMIFFAYLGMIIYDKFRVRLEMKYTLYVIALAVDVIYFYEALVTWMHKKFGYATIFGHHHHEHGTEQAHHPAAHSTLEQHTNTHEAH
jgi:CHASE2 domain-containing sensor protein